MEPNVQTFIKHLNIYHTKKKNYMNAVQNYHSAKALLMKNNEVRKVKTNDISYSNDDYVITHEGVMMYKNKSGNNELSGNYFISNKSFLGGNHSNVYVKHDLNGLYYNPLSNTNKLINLAPKISRISDNWVNMLDEDAHNMTGILTCDGIAKTLNYKYYAVDKDESCHFKITDNIDDIVYNDVDKIIEKDISMNGTTVSYSIPDLPDTDTNESYTKAVLYDVSAEKFNYISHLSNYGYVDYDGSLYNLSSIESNNIIYQPKSNICYSNTIDWKEKKSKSNLEKDCDISSECIGYVINSKKNGLPIFKTKNTDYNPYIYSCDESQNFLYQKIILPKDNSYCDYDPSYIRTISNEDWKYIFNRNNTTNDLSLCGIEGLLHTNKLALHTASGEFETAFENMIISFNLLSTHELQFLQETTDVNAEQMTQINQEYQEYIQRTKKNEEKEKIYKLQKEDSRILYQSTEYKTTIVTLITIVLAIYTFRYMKK